MKPVRIIKLNWGCGPCIAPGWINFDVRDLPGVDLRGDIRKGPDIIASLVAAAKQGDTTAARLILERTVPALRPEEMPVTLDGVGGSRAEMIAAVVQALADGKLDISRGRRLIEALTPEALEERIERFERMIEEQNEQ